MELVSRFAMRTARTVRYRELSSPSGSAWPWSPSKDGLVEHENLRESYCCCSTSPMNDINQEGREWNFGFELERIWEDD